MWPFDHPVCDCSITLYVTVRTAHNFPVSNRILHFRSGLRAILALILSKTDAHFTRHFIYANSQIVADSWTICSFHLNTRYSPRLPTMRIISNTRPPSCKSLTPLRKPSSGSYSYRHTELNCRPFVSITAFTPCDHRNLLFFGVFYRRSSHVERVSVSCLSFVNRQKKTAVATVNKLQLQGHGRTSHPPSPTLYRVAPSQKYSVASFVMLRVLSCHHPPGLRCSWCNVVRFCCDLQACNLVTAAIGKSDCLIRNTFQSCQHKFEDTKTGIQLFTSLRI
jgi:hypothetical protein